MIATLRDSFKIGELRSRILFTLAMIAVYRLGSHIPTPGIDSAALAHYFGQQGGGILGFLDMFSGGALKRFSIFALGIAPYINASIIMQLLVYVVPQLEKLAKEGTEGRQKISQYTRYGTIFIGAIQAFGMSFMLANAGGAGVLTPYMKEHFARFAILTILTLTAGTAFIMWLGEKITEKGIGNGISLLIFVGIVASLPSAIVQTYRVFSGDALFYPKVLIILFFTVAVTAAVIWIQDGVRKIPVQYAKRVVGRRVYGGQNTYIPLRINQAGVIPIIFASSILLFPGLITNFFSHYFSMDSFMGRVTNFINTVLGPSHWVYLSLYCLLIIFFSYFYTAITFNPKDLADNMKKYGGFIPGVRSGRPTAEYIDRTLIRITLVGSIFLAIIAVIPNILISWANVPFYFGGTALLIVVGVGLDTIKQLESHLVTRNYDGFLKKKSRLFK
ncbi:MAG: preprotein translocase subunit SecY [bacterium ADurb.Bin243]|nr:MAG: preprotein translocase subunit SecY [bacterium ADurb.Bin243]HOD41370.1 preprotein translocase subunit SecY [Candidatus Wallbacteria bacterium]